MNYNVTMKKYNTTLFQCQWDLYSLYKIRKCELCKNRCKHCVNCTMLYLTVGTLYSIIIHRKENNFRPTGAKIERSDIMNNEYNDENSLEIWQYAKSEILKKQAKPYIMSNEPLAEYYATHFDAEMPTAVLIKVYSWCQYICFDSRAVKKVKKKLNEDIANNEANLVRLKRIVEVLENL